jgi:hypothetical protein
MKNSFLFVSSLLVWLYTIPLLAQPVVSYRPIGPEPSQAARQQTIDTACDAVVVAPNAPSNAEYARLIGVLAGYLGPTPVPPGMAVPPPSAADLDVAKGIFDRWTDLSCVTSHGTPRLQLFRAAVEQAFGFGAMKEVRPVPQDVAERQIAAIRQRFPGTAFATLVEAFYLNDVAWDARGGGYHASVTATGEQIFEQTLAKEMALLQSNKLNAGTNPEYYNALICAEGAAEGYSPEMIKTYEEGATKFKYYDPIYIAAISFSQEKWGGSWDAIDHVIRWAADDTRSSTGEWMYARLYGYVGQDIVENEILFRATPASWPLMRTGYLEHLKQVPSDNYRHNLLVRYACEAGDRKTYLEYRPILDKQMNADAWQGPLSALVCDEKFKYRPPRT